ncbi:MAG: hypothetical protein RR552_02935 [Oscillospiraceae bacterium]
MNKEFKQDTNVERCSDEDLILINEFSQKSLKKDDVFVFSVVLCDNEVDRDFEKFEVSSLEALSKLFVGKTAIKNHSMNCEDQNARTFKTEVITDMKKTNSLGEPYVYLKAHCYMPRLKKNEDFIAEIECGIKKEVSIGCAISERKCSICNTDTRANACTHKKGKKYSGKLCYFELLNPTDAYEWSFVAVPAQKNAGVTKSFNGEVKNMESILKSLKEKDSLVLSIEECVELDSYISNLKSMASYGEIYRKSLESETVKLFALSIPTLSNISTESIVKSLPIEDLKALKDSLYEKSVSKNATPQLFKNPESKKENNNNEFKF